MPSIQRPSLSLRALLCVGLLAALTACHGAPSLIWQLNISTFGLSAVGAWNPFSQTRAATDFFFIPENVSRPAAAYHDRYPAAWPQRMLCAGSNEPNTSHHPNCSYLWCRSPSVTSETT